ncbi:MAG: alpha/beta hydrolase [Spirochaetes bacterium]|nr:alpha/beta hydrolase [Spirochaetota bacterium]
MEEGFTFTASDGQEIYVYQWHPADSSKIKGMVQIVHGMAEHAARYAYVADKLCNHGYRVFATDHRGHGKTAGTEERVGYLADQDGFQWLVQDEIELTALLKEKYPKLPLLILGHSMGSIIVQGYLQSHSHEVVGAILTGCPYPDRLSLKVVKFLANQEMNKGRMMRSEFMDKLLFGNFNRAFKPNRTGYDWLTRDNNIVDQYAADPYCGFICTSAFYFDFAVGMLKIFDSDNMKKVKKDLPLYILAGDMDPAGSKGKRVKKLFQTYQNKCQIKDVKLKLYPDARHEILNEINKDEVILDILAWIDTYN